jgi:hypothetical protein
MAEKSLKSLLKAPITLWSASAIAAAGLLTAWSITGSGVWLVLALLHAGGIAYWNRHAAKSYGWLYAGTWAVSLFVLAASPGPIAAAGIALFFGFELWLLLGVMQVRFHDTHRQLSLFYFLLVFAAFALFALEGPVRHPLGGMLLMLVFLYLTGEEYVRAETQKNNLRVRVALLVCVLITAQALWLASLLSIGFLNIASLTLVLYITCMMVMVSHFSGALTKREIARNVWFFILFSAAILLISQYV